MCTSAEDIEDVCGYSGEFLNKGLLQKCKKCELKSSILLQKKDPFCKSCFFEYCNHKFRSTIGKSKKINHGMKVLLACSFGRKSAALLHMTQKILKSASLKQISFIPGVIFIDDTFISSDISKDGQDYACAVLNKLKRPDYETFYSSLEMVYNITTEEIFYAEFDDYLLGNFSCDSELRAQMKENYKDLPLSAKVDVLRHLRLLLTTEIAKQAGYDCVFVGDTASSLAVDLLSDIALGRGSQIFLDTSFYDTRYKVPVCKPLREFMSKEIAAYNHFNEVSYEVVPDFLTKASSNSCIQRLTETFLSSLQENFPATVFTVFRTGSKLSKTNASLEERNCIICKSQLDNTSPEPCSALEALKISETLSTGSVYKKSENDNYGKLMQFLCHGCSNIFRNISSKEAFYPLISEVSSMKIERGQMKEEIRGFLLEEDDHS